MTDDAKRLETVSTKLTERMLADLQRAASSEDRTVSDFLFLLVRRELYGRQRGPTPDAPQVT